MILQKLALSIAEALIIYGLIIVGYGILTIHITQTWSGDWPVDRNPPWLTLDTFIMVSQGSLKKKSAYFFINSENSIKISAAGLPISSPI